MADANTPTGTSVEPENAHLDCKLYLYLLPCSCVQVCFWLWRILHISSHRSRETNFEPNYDHCKNITPAHRASKLMPNDHWYPRQLISGSNRIRRHIRIQRLPYERHALGQPILIERACGNLLAECLHAAAKSCGRRLSSVVHEPQHRRVVKHMH